MRNEVRVEPVELTKSSLDTFWQPFVQRKFQQLELRVWDSKNSEGNCNTFNSHGISETRPDCDYGCWKLYLSAEISLETSICVFICLTKLSVDSIQRCSYNGGYRGSSQKFARGSNQDGIKYQRLETHL